MAVNSRAAHRRKAVFLDKDGTIVENVPYNVDPTSLRLSRGAPDALAHLAEAGYRLVVVTNQSGVARGLFPEDALVDVEAELRRQLAARGVTIDGFYYCPHHPQGSVPGYATSCDCRKPRPGLLYRAAAELELDLSDSWLVGDILDDVEAGCRAGCRTVLLDNGGETEWIAGDCREPDAIVPDLLAAAAVVLAGRPSGAKLLEGAR